MVAQFRSNEFCRTEISLEESDDSIIPVINPPNRPTVQRSTFQFRATPPSPVQIHQTVESPILQVIVVIQPDGAETTQLRESVRSQI